MERIEALKRMGNWLSITWSRGAGWVVKVRTGPLTVLEARGRSLETVLQKICGAVPPGRHKDGADRRGALPAEGEDRAVAA